MKLNEAFGQVKGICDNVRCTKQERMVIDEALATIAQAIQPKSAVSTPIKEKAK